MSVGFVSGQVVNVMRRGVPPQLKGLDEHTVHGVKLDERYKLCKVRFSGKRYWVRVWAIKLPARAGTGRTYTRTLKSGKTVQEVDVGVPERWYVQPCPLFPCGGSWPTGQAYEL